MRVRLTWIERDFRGVELTRREETLSGESTKTPTRNYAAKLIARYHPELMSAGRVHLINAEDTGFRWYITSVQLDSNRWVTAYAEPLDENVPPCL